MALLNPLSNAFGLDIGDRAFKLVQFTKRKHSKAPYRLTAWSDIEVPEGVMERGEVKDMDKAVALLAQLVKDAKGKLGGRAAVACLPEAKTFIKVIEIPADTTEDKMRQAIMSEIEINIPLPADEIYYDWQVIEEIEAVKEVHEVADVSVDEAPKKPDETKPEAKAEDGAAKAPEPAAPAVMPGAAKKMKRLLLGAAPKNLVDSYTLMLERAGLAPIALDIEAMAIAQAIVPEEERAGGDAVGLLDIGATRSSLVIYDNGGVQMSISIPISGIEITKIISEALNVPMEDAELLKRECGLDANRCEDKMWKILLPLIDDMTAKIRNALRFYKIGFPMGKKIEKLYLCGGGAQFREIDTVLSRKLTIKVRRGDAMANISPKLPRDFGRDAALQYTTAIGLGLRAADENEKYKNRL
jgi:Tfp pilus assembly PilM family ATPase